MTSPWLLPRKRVLAPKIFFFSFFVVEKISSYTWWWWKKLSIKVSSLFGHLKMSKNWEESVKMPQKIWNSAKSEYQQQLVHQPWNVRMYHHTSYYADHRFPIINTNHFVIHCCEFYLFLNRTVLFQCSQMTFSKICTNAIGKIYRLKKFRTFFDMGIKLKDFASTTEIWRKFLNLTILNYFINSNNIFKM